MRGLFINNKKAKDSIYESGFMVYQCLLLSDLYKLDYIEVDKDNRDIPCGYDFYFFNYHLVTMNWLQTDSLRKRLGYIMTMVLEVAPNDPFVMCNENDFDAFCVLDPTVISKNKRVHIFPRPLEKIEFTLPAVDNKIPVIGTFGFATKGKGFQHVVEAVNKEFDTAIIKINIPYGDFVPQSKEYASFLGDTCKKLANPGIDVQVTHDFMNKEDLIKWCASNTLNCFLYDRNMAGLAATTDQAIVSQRPLSISDNDTFRHITQYVNAYPKWSLKDSIEKSTPLVVKMNQDWSSENFAKKFEKVLIDNVEQIAKKKKIMTNSIFTLDLKKHNLSDTIKARIKKYKRKIRTFKFKTLFNRRNDSKHSQTII